MKKGMMLLFTAWLSLFCFAACILDEPKELWGAWKCEFSETEYFLLEFHGDRYVLSHFKKEKENFNRFFIDGGRYTLVNGVIVFQFDHQELSETELTIVQAQKQWGVLTLTVTTQPKPGDLNQVPETKTMEFKKSKEASYVFELKRPVLHASKGNYNTVLLSWEWDPNADSYTVFRSQKKDSGFIPVAKDLVASPWVDASKIASGGGTFFYQIQASKEDTVLKSHLLSPLSDAVSAVVPSVDPSLEAPRNVQIEIIAKRVKKADDPDGLYPVSESENPNGIALLSGLKLSWDPVAGADYYQVLQSESVMDGEEPVLRWSPCLDIATGEPAVLTQTEFHFYKYKLGEANQFKVVACKINPAAHAGQPDFVSDKDKSVGVGTQPFPSRVPDLAGSGVLNTGGGSGTVSLSWSALSGVNAFRIVKAVKNAQGTAPQPFLPKEASATALSETVSGGQVAANTYQYFFWGQVGIQFTREDESSHAFSPFGDPSEGVWIDLQSSLSVSFWVSPLTVSNPTSTSVTLSWNPTPDASVESYKIFRRLCEDEAQPSGSRLSFPKREPASADFFADENNYVSSFADNAYATVTQMLLVGEVPKSETLSYTDASAGNTALLPGQYRYYVVAGNAFITAVAYKRINEKEFVQLVNRHLDRLVRATLPGGEGSSSQWTAEGGGTFQNSYSSSGLWWDRSYQFSSFKSDYLTLTSVAHEMNTESAKKEFDEKNRTVIYDNGFKYNVGMWYYMIRMGKLTVAADSACADLGYSGTLVFNLARDSKRDNAYKAPGGVRWADFGKLPSEKETGISDSDARTQGCYWVNNAGGSDLHRLMWDDGLPSHTYYQQKNNDFAAQSDEQEKKVEPDFKGPYVEWR